MNPQKQEEQPISVYDQPQELEAPEEEQEEYEREHEMRTLLSWTAPGRPFEKKSKEYFLNILVIMLLLEIILFLFSQYVLMALVLAVAFLSYALNSVAPHDFQFKITTEGVMVQDHFYLWQELYDFYFRKQNGEEVLFMRTKAFFPGELTITLGSMHKEHVLQILLPYLPYREYVKPTFMEKSGQWLEKNFPLDKKPTLHKK